MNGLIEQLNKNPFQIRHGRESVEEIRQCVKPEQMMLHLVNDESGSKLDMAAATGLVPESMATIDVADKVVFVFDKTDRYADALCYIAHRECKCPDGKPWKPLGVVLMISTADK